MELVPFGQGFLSPAAPTAELERLVISRAIWHGGASSAALEASNVTVRQDPAGDIQPDKGRRPLGRLAPGSKWSEICPGLPGFDPGRASRHFLVQLWRSSGPKRSAKSSRKRRNHPSLVQETNTKEVTMAVVLTDKGEFEVAATGGLCVSPGDAEAITGWTLKPEGMCRDELCVPLGDEARRDGKVDIAAFWRTSGIPLCPIAAPKSGY